jgi:hypothetical protein
MMPFDASMLENVQYNESGVLESGLHILITYLT